MEEAHLLSAADVLRRFSVTAEGGLSLEQVAETRERCGPNGERRSPPCGGAVAPLLALGRKPGPRKSPRMRAGHLAGPRGLLREKGPGSGSPLPVTMHPRKPQPILSEGLAGCPHPRCCAIRRQVQTRRPASQGLRGTAYQLAPMSPRKVQ